MFAMNGSQTKLRSDAERRRKALRRIMDEHGLKPASWAKKAGLRSANPIYNFLAGRSRSLSAETSEALATAIGVDVGSILANAELTPAHNEVQTVYIRGHVSAGEWQEAVEWPRSDWRPMTLPKANLHRSTRSYFLEVRGNSMDELYPPGSYLECVPMTDYEGPWKTGLKVICIRTDRTGLHEVTCKEFWIREDGAQAWLRPRSSDPSHRPYQLPWPPGDGESRADGIEEIRIAAVVVRSIRSEVDGV
jgi:SOS-response transcriptional repressor LexA